MQKIHTAHTEFKVNTILRDGPLFVLLSIVVLLMAYTPPAVSEEVFYWRDKNGKLHFSNRPDEKYKKNSIDVKPDSFKSPKPIKTDPGGSSVSFTRQSEGQLAQQQEAREKRQQWLKQQAELHAECQKVKSQWHTNKELHELQRSEGITEANDMAYKEKLQLLEQRIEAICS